jgi:hypothetical protein
MERMEMDRLARRDPTHPDDPLDKKLEAGLAQDPAWRDMMAQQALGLVCNAKAGRRTASGRMMCDPRMVVALMRRLDRLQRLGWQLEGDEAGQAREKIVNTLSQTYADRDMPTPQEQDRILDTLERLGGSRDDSQTNLVDKLLSKELYAEPAVGWAHLVDCMIQAGASIDLAPDAPKGTLRASANASILRRELAVVASEQRVDRDDDTAARREKPQLRM